jgi:hypothetical protein
MFAAMLSAISIMALSQFALYYWRAVLAGAAGQPVSDSILAAAHVGNGHVTGRDFETLVGLHDLTTDLHPGRRAGGSDVTTRTNLGAASLTVFVRVRVLTFSL